MTSSYATDAAQRSCLLIVPAVLLLAAGCVLPPVDMSQKQCPCAPGSQCISGGRCVEMRWDCTPQVYAEGFSAAWTTSRSIRWAWQPQGDADAFGAYELWLWAGEEPRDRTASTATFFDRATNPELAAHAITRADGSLDPVQGAITFGLVHEQPYVAQLLSVDRGGCAWLSEPAARHTSVSMATVLSVFEDEAPSLSEGLSLVPDATGSGAHLEYHVTDQSPGCADGIDLCRVELMLSDLELSLDGIHAGLVHIAQLELAIAIDGPAPLLWSRVEVSINGCTERYSFLPLSLPNDGAGAYNEMIIPLAALERGGNPIDAQRWQSRPAAEKVLCSVTVATEAPRQTTIHMDAVRVAY